ncbi:G0/G1 switch protein 2 [Dipodomys merriami]|uniref:G0/G1 switch protein 2 n=1 Tax=Dipodomys merriami TaxID=94247 RepID=UPI0038556E85
METVQELIPLAKEMMAQKPRGKLVKLYVLGSVLALVGAVLGLVETVCSPFAAASRLREEEAAAAELRDARERQARQALRPPQARPGPKRPPEAQPCSRADRQHAS